MKIYLDNSASSRVCPEAAKAVYLAMTETFANPSALHTAGQEAERLVKQARHQIAFSLGTKPANIVFTSGGTESNNMALFSAFHAQAGQKSGALLVSALEHPAVMQPALVLEARGARLARIPVHGADTSFPGMVDTAAFRELLMDDVALVSVMHVNNEIGTIQPIEELTRIVSLYAAEHGVQLLFHCDAAQSYGKLVIDTGSGDFRRVDFLSISAHKLHGPKGVGAIFAANPGRLHPILFGGGQEGGVRSGTENVPGIAGFGVSARIATADIVGHAKQANACRRRLLEGILAELPEVRINSPLDASITGKPGCGSPYILNASFLGVRGEVLLHELEKSGIFVSTGAACASLGKEGARKPGTLEAIGTPKEAAESALRFGLSCTNTPAEMDFVVDRLKSAVQRLRRTMAHR